jgi:hypothetical protein
LKWGQSPGATCWADAIWTMAVTEITTATRATIALRILFSKLDRLMVRPGLATPGSGP